MFETADGYIQVVALREAQVENLMRLVGHEDLYAANTDPTERVRATAEFNAVLEPIFAAESTEHWLAALADVGVPAAPIHDLAEATSDEQVAHRLSIAQVPDPADARKTVGVVSAGHVADPAPPRVQRDPPTLGQHTDEVLAELGYTEADITALRAEGVV